MSRGNVMNVFISCIESIGSSFENMYVSVNKEGFVDVYLFTK